MRGLLISLSVAEILPHVSCIPVSKRVPSNTPNSTYVGFVDDPSGRGTSSLVISCLLTLVLCVWSALHLNVPPCGRTPQQCLWTYVLWITAGIYAPELVVFTAWRQWSSARLLYRAVQDHDSKDQPARRYAWTMTHSFFASTGGFAFDSSPYIASPTNPDGPLPQGSPTRLTITARGIALLASLGHVPDIPKADIEDKSKADTLGKTLVLLQASWMLLQVIARLIAHLPVTLLEVNTVAHVLCAILMYVMWWSKPLNSREPIVLREPWVGQLLPYMYMSSEVSGLVDDKHIKSQTLVKTLFASIKLYSKTPEISFICIRPKPTEEPKPKSNTLDIENTQMQCVLRDTTCKEDAQNYREKSKAETAFFERRPKVRASTSTYLSPDDCLYRRRQHLISVFTQHHDIIETTLHKSGDIEGLLCYHITPSELVAEYSRNWPSDELLRDVNGLVVGMILWLANLVYGSIHLAAWNNHFPSDVEKWMWRSSAAYIGFCGGLWVVLNYIVSRWSRLNAFWERWMEGEKSWFANLSLGFLVIICGFSLIVARAYIVVEAFLSIRELPREAYETPSWSQVFPHF